jgi:hypothetical protein
MTSRGKQLIFQTSGIDNLNRSQEIDEWIKILGGTYDNSKVNYISSLLIIYY